jgi:hypothetical protein
MDLSHSYSDAKKKKKKKKKRKEDDPIGILIESKYY